MIYEITKTTRLDLYIQDDLVDSLQVKEEIQRIKIYSSDSDHVNLDRVLKALNVCKCELDGDKDLYSFNCYKLHDFCTKIYYVRNPNNYDYDLIDLIERYFTQYHKLLVELCDKSSLEDTLDDDTDYCYITISENYNGKVIE